MREQPRQIYTSVRSPQASSRVSQLAVRAIVVAAVLILSLAVIAVAVTGLV